MPWQSFQDWLQHLATAVAAWKQPGREKGKDREALTILQVLLTKACSACLQVVDETDRMLRQSYQDWLQHLTTAVAAQKRPGHERVVKVVASATLTRDPSKLERLGLHCPRYIAMTSQDHRHVSIYICMLARMLS